MNFHDIATAETVAILPPRILWAAAQFASTDKGKPALTTIQAEQSEAGGSLTIRSVDGHRAFRTMLPAQLAYIQSPDPAELRIDASQWRTIGRILSAEHAHLKSDGTAHLINSKGLTVEIRQWQTPIADKFPNITQIWPDQFPCEPGLPVRVDAAYVAQIATVAAKLSPSATVSFETGTTTSPMQWLATYAQGEHTAEVEVLLMPVQVRNSGPRYQFLEAERAARELAARRDARELAAFRARELAQLPTISRELAHV